MTVLLVDDDEDDIEVFKEVLGLIDKSIIFMTAHNGREALTILESDIEAPDHIFLDINMPLMNGMDCLTEIRRRFPDLRSTITVYSTTSNSNYKTQSLKLGAGYLRKPDGYQDLLVAVQNRLMSA